MSSITDRLVNGGYDLQTGPSDEWNEFARFLIDRNDAVTAGAVAGHICLKALSSVDTNKTPELYGFMVGNFAIDIQPPMTEAQEALFNEGATHALTREMVSGATRSVV